MLQSSTIAVEQWSSDAAAAHPIVACPRLNLLDPLPLRRPWCAVARPIHLACRSDHEMQISWHCPRSWIGHLHRPAGPRRQSSPIWPAHSYSGILLPVRVRGRLRPDSPHSRNFPQTQSCHRSCSCREWGRHLRKPQRQARWSPECGASFAPCPKQLCPKWHRYRWEFVRGEISACISCTSGLFRNFLASLGTFCVVTNARAAIKEGFPRCIYRCWKHARSTRVATECSTSLWQYRSWPASSANIPSVTTSRALEQNFAGSWKSLRQSTARSPKRDSQWSPSESDHQTQLSKREQQAAATRESSWPCEILPQRRAMQPVASETLSVIVRMLKRG